MKKFESIEDVALALGDGGPFNPDTNYETAEELVDALVEIGYRSEVINNHDDHLGLKSTLSEDFLKSQLSDIDKPEFESDINAVLEQANTIIPLLDSETSSDDI